MAKLHTRQKRRLQIVGRDRKKRPKTFKSEQAANEYAKKHDIKSYILENLKSPESRRKKIRIVMK